MLVLEHPGGETLDGFLSGAMEMTQFFGGAVGLATALSGLHKRKLIHKDEKPTIVLVNSARGQVALGSHPAFGASTWLQSLRPWRCSVGVRPI